MSLKELWNSSRKQLMDKHVQQIIAFAGSGNLADGSQTAAEFRELLAIVPSTVLSRYAEECLSTSFPNSGLVLQDAINEIGARLDFTVAHGLYRGRRGQIGYDGLWLFPDGHGVVVEVKTTDTYRIHLDTIADYRRKLIDAGEINKDKSSILIVVGRQDTGDLEAQIRGSRHAWDMRLISVDALMRLMLLKENLDDPVIIRRIYDILIPREFTKLDDIVEIVFSAAEEAKQEDALPDTPAELAQGEGSDVADAVISSRSKPVAFHEKCIDRVEAMKQISLVRRSRTKYVHSDGQIAAICSVSKEHELRDGHVSYWFAFHSHQSDYLAQFPESYVVLGCGSPETILLIPFQELVGHLDEFWTTERNGGEYWHMRVHRSGDKLLMDRKAGFERWDVTSYLLA